MKKHNEKNILKCLDKKMEITWKTWKEQSAKEIFNLENNRKLVQIKTKKVCKSYKKLF